MTQHVRMLRHAGEQAWLWLPDPDDRTDWIDADLPVLSGATTPIGSDDLLVLPETPIVHGHDPAPGARKVILNQNHFYTFAAGPPGDHFPAWSPPPTVWTVTAESRDVVAGVLPHLEVRLIPNAVEGSLFHPHDAARPRVSWFPRKRPREASLLRRLLAAAPQMGSGDVELVELVDAPRPVVAQTLGTSTIFVALGHSESFGLPVAEALASGCLVVGYDGGGGHELFEAPGVWRVPEQRPLLLRDRVLDLLTRADELAPLRAANRDWVLERYSSGRAEQALLTVVVDAFRGRGGDVVAQHPAALLHLLGPSFTAWA